MTECQEKGYKTASGRDVNEALGVTRSGIHHHSHGKIREMKPSYGEEKNRLTMYL